MIKNVSHVMTLANSVIGVSVLAMPFCFKQCGIILGILMLLLSSILSKLACHFLVKSAIMTRRNNFEFLAFYAFGRTGKLLAELFIIGFLMGTCIAFFVVVGDLGPEIVGKIVDKTPNDIRSTLLVIIGTFIILPLGLLRNVDSLSSICTATIGFYLCLVLKVMTESMSHIFATDWYDKVFYWRPSGILQCLPIFSMALFCQTQLFEIYETIPNVCLDKMNRVVDAALNICTVVYVCVGFFGYVAFCNLPLTGNILMSFEPSLSSDVIKIGFVLSVAFTFPLVIFPCRASLNSLLFRLAHLSDSSSNYIPETRFKFLTFLIVSVSLIVGILIPNIEFVLGIVGSTIGVMICLMFPAAFFISISSKNTNERLLAQAMLFVGIWIMILGTYANLYAIEESGKNNKLSVTPEDSLLNSNNKLPINLIDGDRNLKIGLPLPNSEELRISENSEFKPLEIEKVAVSKVDPKDDIRQEPPIPVERSVVTEKTILETVKFDSRVIQTLSPVDEAIKNTVENKLDDGIRNNDDDKTNNDLNKKSDNNRDDKMEKQVIVADEKLKEIVKIKEKKKNAIPLDIQNNNNNNNNNNENLINSDAIKKEESELAADAKLSGVSSNDEAMREELKKTLEKHKIEQRELLNEQIEIMNAVKRQKIELDNERKKEKIVNNVDKREKSLFTVSDKIETTFNDMKKSDNEKSVVRSLEKVKDDKNLKDFDKIEDLKLIEEVKKSPGPILSVLTKQQQQQLSSSSSKNVVGNIDKILPLNRSNDERISLNLEERNISKIDGKTLNNNRKGKLSVPIALAMSEKSKKLGSDFNEKEKKEKPALEKSKDVLAIGRDILENDNSNERMKRDVDKNSVNDDDKIGSFVNEIAMVDIPKEECVKNAETVLDLNKMKNEQPTTESILIKTNSYLSDHGLVANENSLDNSFDLKIALKKSFDRRDFLVEQVNHENGKRK